VAACPASATAAQRFASPGGSPIAPCTAAIPCSIATAINNAGSNDEVILAGDQGSYGTPGTPISTPLGPSNHPVSIHGAAGQPLPLIYSNASLAFDAVSGDTASRLALVKLGSGTGIQLADPVDHVVFVATQSTAIACSVFAGATLTNSICDGGSAGVVAGSGCGSACTFNDTLRNDTVIGATRGIWDTAGTFNTENVLAANTIVSASGHDIVTSTTSGVAANVIFDHSNYRTVDTSSGGTVTPAGSGTNQTASPGFVNAAAGDFHEAAGSPTIDGGITSPLNGTTDLDGNPRALGASTDIGAYEFIPPVSPPSPAPGPTGRRAAALKSCKKRAHKRHWPHRRLKNCRKRAKLLPL
jgi:hypothetical protein